MLKLSLTGVTTLFVPLAQTLGLTLPQPSKTQKGLGQQILNLENINPIPPHEIKDAWKNLKTSQIVDLSENWQSLIQYQLNHLFSGIEIQNKAIAWYDPEGKTHPLIIQAEVAKPLEGNTNIFLVFLYDIDSSHLGTLLVQIDNSAGKAQVFLKKECLLQISIGEGGKTSRFPESWRRETIFNKSYHSWNLKFPVKGSSKIYFWFRKITQ